MAFTHISEGSSQPEKDIVELRILDSDLAIRNWISYTFNSAFLTPTDGWSFTVANANMSDALKKYLVPGSKVQLSLNGLIQASGYVDSVERHAERASGTEWVVEGRDMLAMAVDSCVDPLLRFTPKMTLEDVLIQTFKPFGWDHEGAFAIDNEANVNVMTGQKRGQKRSKVTITKRGNVRGGKILKKYGIDMLRPHIGEGAFAFASRIAQRFGLWIWCSADGKQLIVDAPDIEGIAAEFLVHHIFRAADGHDSTQNNVLGGGVRFDFTDQPSCIIAEGYSGGGEFGRSPIKCRMYNPLTGLDKDGFVLDSVSEVFAKHANAVEILHEKYERLSGYTPIGVNRALYLHDEESQNIEQLEGYIRREMSSRLRKAITAHYTVKGHTQQVDEYAIPWEVGSYVNVSDDISNVHEVMWCSSRTFSKSRGGGTTTALELIRLNSLQF